MRGCCSTGMADPIEASNINSLPCEFTAFIGYEWTASPNGANLHRNIIFRNDSVPFIPFSAFTTTEPRELWNSLDQDCGPESGCEAIVIPHNTNLSKGQSLKIEYEGATTLDEERAIAMQRERLERLLELIQHKGASECMPGFTNDESCGFELVSGRLPVCEENEPTDNCISEISTFRGALKAGLEEQARIGINPLRLGAMASTDTHNGTAGDVEEDKICRQWRVRRFKSLSATGWKDKKQSRRIDCSIGRTEYTGFDLRCHEAKGDLRHERSHDVCPLLRWRGPSGF